MKDEGINVKLKQMGATILWLIANVASAQSISAESKLLAQCENAYLYAAQLLQIQNNEGAARALVRRSSMMTVANFMMNEDKGVIAAWKIQEFRLLGASLNRDFHAGTKNFMTVVDYCDHQGMPIAAKIRSSEKVLWGKSFDELQLGFFEKTRKTLGI